MATLKLFVFSVLFAIVITIVTSQSLLQHDISSVTKVSDSSLRIELELLKSRISLLEISINERSSELRQKEESIRQMEKIIQEKSESIASLQSEIESLQTKKGYRNAEHEERLDAQETIAKNKIHKLYSKLENLQKVGDGQTTIIRKNEHALQEAKLCVVTQWKEYGRPVTKDAIDKALKIIDEAGEWIDLTTETIKTEWIPNLRKWWYTFNAYLESCCQLLAEIVIHVYHVSKSSIVPNIQKALKVAHPYIQEAKRLGELQIHQLTILARPHIDKVHAALKPYFEEVLHVYKKLITTSTSCHGQVQEMLKNNDVTRPYATMELAWFVATALLALPVVFLFKLHTAIFRKKVKKRMRSSHRNHMPRRLN